MGGVGGQNAQGHKKKKVRKVSTRKSVKREEEKRESGYHRDDKKTRASSMTERMIHRFLKCETQRQRPSLALDPVYPSYIAPKVTWAPVSALFDPFA